MHTRPIHHTLFLPDSEPSDQRGGNCALPRFVKSDTRYTFLGPALHRISPHATCSWRLKLPASRESSHGLKQAHLHTSSKACLPAWRPCEPPMFLSTGCGCGRTIAPCIAEQHLRLLVNASSPTNLRSVGPVAGTRRWWWRCECAEALAIEALCMLAFNVIRTDHGTEYALRCRPGGWVLKCKGAHTDPSPEISL